MRVSLLTRSLASAEVVAQSDVSRTSNISVSSYLRTTAPVQGQDDIGNDLLMARVDLTPALDGHVGSSIRSPGQNI